MTHDELLNYYLAFLAVVHLSAVLFAKTPLNYPSILVNAALFAAPVVFLAERLS